MRGVIFLVLAGCNQIFDLQPTKIVGDPSGDGGGGSGSGSRPVVPPDGTTVCGAPPSFESWTYAQGSIPFADTVVNFGLYGDDHMMVTPLVGDSVWDLDLGAGTSAKLEGVTVPSGRTISSLSVSPDGAAIWFKIDVSSYVATRVGGFVKDLTDFGMPDAYELLPGNPGFYNGTLRMVVRLREQSNSQQQYVELMSNDGLTWTRADTLPFTSTHPASLSADGCTLVFSVMDTGSSYALMSSSRMSSGTFATPVKLTAATAAATFPIAPALAPDHQSIWFSAFVQTNRLFEGHP